MKTLKQKFTRWFNRKHDRVGGLWETRFKSIIVEGHWNSLLKGAAYIDLNSVRAGLADDPKDYRWCGYSEAVVKVFRAGGKLSLARWLRCRVRYFSDGLAVGRGSFVESLFKVFQEHFSPGREAGSRRMKGGDWGEMRTARALQVKPIDAGGG